MPRAVKVKAGAIPAAAGGVAKKAKKSKLYAMPEKISEGTVLTDLSKTQWCIGPSIGTGGFGEIYSACRVGEKNYNYVVKCEPHGNGPLFVEMHFYMRNAKLEDIQRFQSDRGIKSLGMPYMLGNGSADINGQKHRFIVMPRYGSDVAKHFIANGRRLPEATAYRLALQMLDVYEFVHSCGYVHADLKGANILLGYGKGGGAQAYLVDYGLASHYTTKEFKPDPKKMHNGTIEYTSRDAHHGVPTMRADLEILGYNLIEWLGMQLPWVRDNLLATPIKVQKAKEEFIDDVSANLKRIFVQGVPVPIAEFMKYVAKMQYNETPDYEKCRKIFAAALKTMKVGNAGELDFKSKGTNNNNNHISSPPKTSKAKAIVKSKALPKADSSVDIICASDDDDDDVVFETNKKPAKALTHKTLKTTAKPHNTKTTKSSPQRKVIQKKTPSPLKQKLTPNSSNTSSSPLATSPRKSPTQKNTKTSAKKTPLVSSSSSARPSRSTPLSAKAKINFSPAISMSSRSSSRPGKTIINDSLTPNPRAGKTYEFNFELDVSMDANVVVNVKRKKKPLPTTQASAQATRDDSPVTRVKVRKLASEDDASSSPRTPAVTVKKSKRIQSPR